MYNLSCCLSFIIYQDYQYLYSIIGFLPYSKMRDSRINTLFKSSAIYTAIIIGESSELFTISIFLKKKLFLMYMKFTANIVMIAIPLRNQTQTFRNR